MKIYEYLKRPKLKLFAENFFQMVYEIDGKKIDIFEVAKAGSKLVSIGGQLSFVCRTSDASDAISFTTPDSFLVSAYFL